MKILKGSMVPQLQPSARSLRGARCDGSAPAATRPPTPHLHPRLAVAAPARCAPPPAAVPCLGAATEAGSALRRGLRGARRLGGRKAEDEGRDMEEGEKEVRRKEAHSRAVVLEMIGDLPEADAKPPDSQARRLQTLNPKP